VVKNNKTHKHSQKEHRKYRDYWLYQRYFEKSIARTPDWCWMSPIVLIGSNTTIQT